MEIAVVIIGMIIVAGLFEELTKRFKLINWTKFLIFLIFGTILLALIFSFTAEGVFVIIGAYVTLVILALLFGFFSKKMTHVSYEQSTEKVRQEIAKDLLDVLDDNLIANKTKLPIDQVRALRLKK